MTAAPAGPTWSSILRSVAIGAIVLAWVYFGFLALTVNGMAELDEDGSGSAWWIVLLMTPATLVGAGLVMVIARPLSIRSWWTRLAAALMTLGMISLASFVVLLLLCDC